MKMKERNVPKVQGNIKEKEALEDLVGNRNVREIEVEKRVLENTVEPEHEVQTEIGEGVEEVLVNCPKVATDPAVKVLAVEVVKVLVDNEAGALVNIEVDPAEQQDGEYSR